MNVPENAPDGLGVADIGMGTADLVVDYYQNSQSYLTGPLQGTCHFGYSDPEEIHTRHGDFELITALHAMETLLGNKLALPPDSTVVDAGCGYGRVATTMAEEFGLRVIGADLTPVRLVEARRFTREHGLAG